jgi:hypothetical protein
MRVLALVCLLCIPFAFAHGFGDEQTIQSGDRLIEFGISDPHPKTGDLVGMSFSIDEDGMPIDTDAHVRISRGSTMLFADSRMHLSNETLTVLSYTFEEPGVYQVDISTAEDSGTFEVKVSRSMPWDVIIAAVLGIAAGILCAAASRMIRR